MLLYPFLIRVWKGGHYKKIEGCHLNMMVCLPVCHALTLQQYPGVNQLSSSLGGLSLQHSQQPESLRPVNLTHDRNILPVSSVPAPVPNLNSDLRKLNCSPE